MAISKGLLVSLGEKRTHQILEQYSDHLRVFPKVRFFDVIDWNTRGITSREHAYLEKTHFDFVITEPFTPFKPLFAVEFDGIGQYSAHIDPYRELKRDTKLRVCQQEDFPVLWIEWDELRDFGGETILDVILLDYIIEQQINPSDVPEIWVRIFEPTTILLKKYRPFIVSISHEGELDYLREQIKGNWIEIRRRIQVRTDLGDRIIVRSVRVRNIRFPYVSIIAIAEDLSTYACLKALDDFVKSGELFIDGDVLRVNLPF